VTPGDRKLQYQPRTCQHCGGVFTPQRIGARGSRFCPRRACQSARTRLNHPERERARKRASARRCREARKPKGRRCLWCGEPIPDAARANKTYCSKRCAFAAYRDRNPEREAARVRAWKQANVEKVRAGRRRRMGA
jgi:hypothetical protein